jgi:GT2 family glycosyltransferase
VFRVDLSIIIVNYNSKDYLRQCLDSIFTKTHAIEFEIIIVDSGSFDGCAEMIEEMYPEVLFIQSESNIGFARANNLGAGSARGQVLLFLNPDTEMHEPAIEKLYTRFQSLSAVGIAGGRLLNSDGSLQTSCVQPLPTVLNQLLDAEVFQRWFPKTGFWTTAATFRNETKPVEVEALCGACLMIHRGVFEQVGGFSTDYFMYGEDLDLCYKTRKAAFKNYYVPDANIIHHGGGSTSRSISNFSNVMMRESVYRFLLKSRGRLHSGGYRVGLSGAAVIRMALLIATGPVWFARRDGSRWGATFRKWLGILRWGFGLQRWIRKYDPPPATATGLGDPG